MPASIVDPFMVTSLPRLPSSGKLSDQCKIAKIPTSTSTSFDIAVNGSYVATFILKPSPRMIWSHSLSPSVKVDAIDSCDLDNEAETQNSSDGGKIYAVGLSDRNKHSLKLIKCENLFSTDANDDSESVIDIKIDSQAVGVRIMEDKERVVVLDSEGTVKAYPIRFNNEKKEAEDPKPLFTLKKRGDLHGSVIYYRFVKYSDFDLGKTSTKFETADKLETVLIFVERIPSEQTNTQTLQGHIRAFGQTSALDIVSSTLKLPEEVGNSELEISFDPSGRIVVLTNGEHMKLYTYRLPYLELDQTVDLGWLFKDEEVEGEASIIPASTNRMLVAKNGMIALIDTEFKALLTKFDVMDKAKRQGKAVLMQAPMVKGNTLRSRETFALYLVSKSAETGSILNQVTVDTGLGKLRDVLGRGLREFRPKFTQKSKRFVGLPLLVTRSELKSKIKEASSLLNRSGEASNKMGRVYEQLKEMKRTKKYEELEQYIVSFLKMDKSADAGRGLQSTENGEVKTNEAGKLRVYEAGKDRIVDPKFFRKVALLLFDRVDNRAIGTKIKVQLNENFIPEHALTYLLTHPLFPKDITPGLLNVLSVSPRLMRQAIVTCPNIPCSDLIEQMSLVEDADMFKDIVGRVTDDFALDTITEEMIRLANGEAGGSNAKIDVDGIIRKVMDTGYGISIMNSLIDSNGVTLSLHYSKNESELGNLTSRIEKKVSECEQQSRLLSIIDQSLSLVDGVSGRKKREQAERRRRRKTQSQSKTVEAESGPTDSMLNVGSVSNELFDSSLSNTKRVPTYSIERLEI